MYEFKNALKSNKLILISLALFAAVTEVLLGIMDCRLYDGEMNYFRFSGNIVFRLVMLAVGICLAYLISGVLKFDFFPQFLAPVFTAISVICSCSGLAYAFDTNYKAYSLCSVAAVITLAFYYVSRCGDSLGHTLFYVFLITVLAVGTLDEIEVFIVLSVHILLFVYNYKNFTSNSVKAVNCVFVALAAAALVMLFICQIIDYMAMRYFEGETIFYIEKMFLTVPAFGDSEFFGEIADKRSEYNLAKIFGSYGYVIGTFTVLVIVAFVASISIKCVKQKGEMKPALIAASVILAVRSISALFINFGVITGTRSVMLLISEGHHGYFIVGLLVGLTVAASKNYFSEEELKHGNYILYSALL